MYYLVSNVFWKLFQFATSYSAFSRLSYEYIAYDCCKRLPGGGSVVTIGGVVSSINVVTWGVSVGMTEGVGSNVVGGARTKIWI